MTPGGSHGNHGTNDVEGLDDTLDEQEQTNEDVDARLATIEALLDQEPVDPPPDFPTPSPEPTDLLRHTTYEPGEERVENDHASRSYSLVDTTEASRMGSQAGQADRRRGDPNANGGRRAEWHGVDWAALDAERWHGICYWLPGGGGWHQGNEGGFTDRIIYQWHTSGGPGWSPIYGLAIQSDRSSSDAKANTSARNPRWVFYRKDRYRKSDGSWGYKNVTLWEESASEETWVDFVFHVKWTINDDGFIEVFRNKARVWGDSGIRTMNDSNATAGPYSKWGIYGQPTRILFDEVRIAEGPNRLDDVSP